MVEDLGSTNGTYLNQARVTAVVPIMNDNHIMLGSKIIFRFMWVG